MKIETLAKYKENGETIRVINVERNDPDDLWEEILDLDGIMLCRADKNGRLEFKHINRDHL